MTIPGFSAEAALRGAGGGRYHGLSPSPQTDYGVRLADWVDQACLSGCMKDCGLECAGTSGSGKAACIHACARENAQCQQACTRPGDPPSGPGGGGSPGGGSTSPCGSGTLCMGGCCPPGFPSCTFSGVTAVCCPAGFTHSVTVFGVNICLP